MRGAAPIQLSLKGPQSLWRAYCSSLTRRPVLTKALTSLVGFALGDAVAQLSNRPRKGDTDAPYWKYDSYRTVRLATYGGMVAGPLGHFWFSFLDSNIFAATPRRSTPKTVLVCSPQAIVTKIALDQSLMTPVGTSIFFSFTKLMDGQLSAVIPTVQEKLVPTCLASIKLWPIAHAINFAFIPSSQRLLYINVISIFWTIILSKAASQGGRTEAVASSPPMLVIVPVLEDEHESLASIGFLDEMEALEAEYDKE